MRELEKLADCLITEIMSDPRPVQSKLSTTPFLNWTREFLLSLSAFQALEKSLVAAFKSSKLRFSTPLSEQARVSLFSALARAMGGESERDVTFYGPVFKENLLHLARALQAASIEFTLCRRLIGIEMPEQLIQLSESVQLVRLSEEELAARMPPLELVQYGLVSPDLAAFNKVEVRVRRRESLQDFDSLLRGPARPRVFLHESERVQEALLLMGAEGQVELGSYLFQASDPPLGNCAVQPLNYSGSGIIFPPLTLHPGHIPQLQRCFEVAQKTQSYPALKSALHRYTIACSRTRPEDSLVDLVIGFESILLQGLQNELSHRFSLNGSSLSHWILGKPRKESYQLFRAAYAARSSVVHGYGGKLKASRLESLSNELRHLLAVFLTWLIQDSAAHNLRPRLESDDWLRLLFESPPPLQ